MLIFNRIFGLNRELRRGKRQAAKLAQHLEIMGAVKGTIGITLKSGRAHIVTVEVDEREAA